MSDALDDLVREFLAALGPVVSNDGAETFEDLPDRLRDALITRAVEPVSLPVVDSWLGAAVAGVPAQWAGLAEALLEAAPVLNWMRAYEHFHATPEVESFRGHYAFAALAGPVFRGRTPPFLAEDLLVGFSIQAPGVTYPAHHHESPELYGVMNGELEWQVGVTWSTRRAGDVVLHRSHESHAMVTGSTPVLAWACWSRNPHCHVYMPSLDPADNTMEPVGY